MGDHQRFYRFFWLGKGHVDHSLLGVSCLDLPLYNGRLNDRQKEIDRLIQENREYRKIFIALLDQRLDYQKPEIPPPDTKSLSEKKE